MKEIILNVEGMACGGCENRIQNAISIIEGIKEVKADHVKGIVKITAKEDIDVNKIKEKIDGIGFFVKDEK